MVLVYINPSLAVFLSILCLLATGALGYFLFKLVVKEMKRYREEVANFIDGVESKAEITAEINAYISKSKNSEFSLLLIDIDKFRNIVETFGQVESERVIKNLVDKIIKTLPLRMSIGRIKEDQFVILARGEYSREEMVRLAKKLLEVINEPVKVYDESTLNLSCSIGMCYYPSHGQNFKQLYGSLEIACYVCKRSGGNQFRIYSPESNKDESANMEYYYQIKEGIKNKEFTLYYQPIISGSNEDIFAIEGLLRWNHPTLGILSPFKFISIMEQTGDISWVGLWGFECLVKKHVELKKKFNKEYRMSLNLSPKQLANVNLPQEFQKLLKKYRVAANQFILEIEEFTIFERLDTVQNNLIKLSELGFSIAVDGIGLDYKALKKLEEHSIDIVKIDRDFLDSGDTKIKEKFIEILVDFSKHQNCTIVSEGIEDYHYLDRARELSLNVFQGYLFSKPISADAIEEYLEKNSFVDILNKVTFLDDIVLEDVVPTEVIGNKDDLAANNEETVVESEIIEEKQIVEPEVKEEKTTSKKTKKSTKKQVEELVENEKDEVASDDSIDKAFKETDAVDEPIDEQKNKVEVSDQQVEVVTEIKEEIVTVENEVKEDVVVEEKEEYTLVEPVKQEEMIVEEEPKDVKEELPINNVEETEKNIKKVSKKKKEEN